MSKFTNTTITEKKRGKVYRQAALAIAISAASLLGSSGAFSDEMAQRYSIEIQQLDTALKTFAEQTNMQVIYPPELVTSLQTKGVTGKYQPKQALKMLLAGTDLDYEFASDKLIVISERNDSQSDSPQQNNSPRKIDKSNREQRIEEIIITATKRSESIQDVPMSITAIDDQEMDRRGFSGMDDYLRLLPGVNIIDQGVGFNTIIMRGVSTRPNYESLINGSTVGIYFSEIPIAKSEAYGNVDLKLVDMERIEVLRGPQGTLFGSGSMGGTIRNIPKAPNLQEFEGSVEAEYSNTSVNGSNNYNIQGVINIPLIQDELAIRGVIYQYENSGHVKNLAGEDPDIIASANSIGMPERAINSISGDSKYTGARLSALWRPRDEMDLTFNYIRQKSESIGITGGYINLDIGEYANAKLHPGDLVGDEGLRHETDIFNFVVEYDFSWAKLISSSTYIDELNASTDSWSPTWSLKFDFRPEQFTQEIRLASQFDGAFQFIAGLYYDDTETIRDGVHLNPVPGAEQLLGFYYLTTKVDQKAFFGELSYDLTDQLNLTVGARAFSYERVDDDVAGGPLFGSATGTYRATDESGATYKLDITYTPNEDSLVYAKWSEGFRLGRGHLQPPEDLCDVDKDGLFDGTNASIIQKPIESDSLDNYELGGKFSFLDSRWTINAALFRINWDGIPLAVASPTQCGFFIYANAGGAISEGVELESSLYLTDAFRINIGTSYVNAELSTDAPSLGGKKGNRLPGSPRFKFNLGLQYDFDVAGHSSFISSDYAYIGDFYNSVQESAASEAGNYHQVNMKAGTSFDNLAVSVFVKNLTNDNSFTLAFARSAVLRLRPRTIGINVKYLF